MEKHSIPAYDADHEISYNELLSVVRNGLPKTMLKKKVIVVGAGLAGLSAAYVLHNAGHEVCFSLQTTLPHAPEYQTGVSTQNSTPGNRVGRNGE